MRFVVAVGTLAWLLLVARVDPAAAQIATISFPDTPVGSGSTVQCPTTSVSLCFGAGCAGSGVVTGVNGPAAPFAIGGFNLLTSGQFFGGNCTANPVTLPVAVGPNQVLAYQATFSPTAPGSFTGAATFSTSGGPASVGFTGQGTGSPPPPKRTDKGGVFLQIQPESLVPGSILDVKYRTARGTLQGNVDIYLALTMPGGGFLFLTSSGVSSALAPFRANVAIADETTPFGTVPFPVDLPFGTYTFYMVLAYAGADPLAAGSLASAISQASISFSPLSAAQQAILQSRGNPNFLAVFWLQEALQKRESWLYLSDPPTQYAFVNGDLESQNPVPEPGTPGPNVDPSLFTPQTTLEQLTAAFGPPTSVTPVDGAPEYQRVEYGFGLHVILRNGRLVSATTGTP